MRTASKLFIILRSDRKDNEYKDLVWFLYSDGKIKILQSLSIEKMNLF